MVAILIIVGVIILFIFFTKIYGYYNPPLGPIYLDEYLYLKTGREIKKGSLEWLHKWDRVRKETGIDAHGWVNLKHDEYEECKKLRKERNFICRLDGCKGTFL